MTSATLCTHTSDSTAIIRIATKSDANAIYPDYGFLAENPTLAKTYVGVDITFMGSSVECTAPHPVTSPTRSHHPPNATTNPP